MILLIAVPAALLAWLAAFFQDKDYRARHREAAPYKLGYFIAYYTIFQHLGVFLSLGATRTEPSEAIAYAVFLLVLSIPQFFVFNRKRWSFILGTICSFNVVIWIVGGIHASTKRHLVWPNGGGTSPSQIAPYSPAS